MESLYNSFMSFKYAIEMFVNSTGFIVELVGYLPAILGSGVIIFMVAYIIRFALLK